MIAIDRAVGDRPKPAVGDWLETAISLRLHLVGDGTDKETPTDALGWIGAIVRSPALDQFCTGEIGERVDLSFEPCDRHGGWRRG